MRKTLFFILIWALPYHIFAQNEIDALRYSFITHGGTARYQGMSGAFGALGADFSSLSTNPAGIGMFKKSRFMFSPVFMMNAADANYKDKHTSEENVFVNVNNFGLVLNLKPYEEDNSAWNSVAFGIGYNKLRNFNNDITISGYNNISSRLDQFMLNSDGYTADKQHLGEPEWLAYDTYLIDYANIPNNTGLLYIHPYYGKYYINQKKNIKTTGGIGEYVFSIGGNYADVFQIGITFGIQNARYKEVSTFYEQSDSTDLESFDFTENLETKGTGYNFKFGMIYRPVNAVRIGLAFHTPTFYKFKDIFSYEMNSHFRTVVDGYSNYHSASDTENESNYEIYTPWRAISSVAFVIGQYGIISADYEYVNYGKARMRSEEYDYTDINTTIKDIYKSGNNLRLGAEMRIAPLFIRGGVSYYGSPYSSQFDATGAIKGYSLGLGLQTENVFIDLAFNHSSHNIDYQLYDYEAGTERAKIAVNEDMINITIGFKF
jgi:hypothetical protein